MTWMYKNNKREDPLDDDIGAIITRLRNRTTWNREAERNRNELRKLFKKGKYILTKPRNVDRNELINFKSGKNKQT